MSEKKLGGGTNTQRIGDWGLAIVEVAFLGTGAWFLLSPVTRVLALLALAEAVLYLAAASFAWVQGLKWTPVAHILCSVVWVSVAIFRGVT